MPSQSPSATLRDALRQATKAEHNRLDGLVTLLDFSNADDYRRFLSLQLMARAPVEQWLATQSLPIAPPPPLADLLAADLADLGGSLTGEFAPFAPPGSVDAIGACWAIAGSSLGNRAMHRALTNASGDALPARFLADGAMTEYWQGLKPLLDRPSDGDDQAAVAAAQAVFAAFLHAAERCLGSETAA